MDASPRCSTNIPLPMIALQLYIQRSLSTFGRPFCAATAKTDELHLDRELSDKYLFVPPSFALRGLTMNWPGRLKGYKTIFEFSNHPGLFF